MNSITDLLDLEDAISVDEVFLDMDDNCKYALVIQDFHTGDPIDLLRSRRTNVTEPYFTSIPPEERNSVKYLISDMYNPYISYVDKHFPNAVPVVNSFSCISLSKQIGRFVYLSIERISFSMNSQESLKSPFT